MGDTGLREWVSGTLRQPTGRTGAKGLDKGVSYARGAYRVFLPLGCLLHARALAELRYYWGGIGAFEFGWHGSLWFWLAWKSLFLVGMEVLGFSWHGSPWF